MNSAWIARVTEEGGEGLEGRGGGGHRLNVESKVSKKEFFLNRSTNER